MASAKEDGMSTAFVTGGSGFVGRSLIPYLIGKGYRVRALARSEAASRTVSRLGAEPVRGDLDAPVGFAPVGFAPVGFEAGLRGCDVIFHAGARVEDRWLEPGIANPSARDVARAG